jgi:K+-transporting ATPase KdpF subunit
VPLECSGAPGRDPTALLDGLLDNLGLIVFTLVTAALVVYLLYAMLRPEKF